MDEDKPFQTPVSDKTPVFVTKDLVERWINDYRSTLNGRQQQDSQPSRDKKLHTSKHAVKSSKAKSSPEKTDIFATPNNDEFYARHAYGALGTANPEIRLLKVHSDRLSLEQAKHVFPKWSEAITRYTSPIILDPGQIAPPAIDVPLEHETRSIVTGHAGAQQLQSYVSITRPHGGFEFERYKPSPSALDVPFGWGVARGYTPYFATRDTRYPTNDATVRCWANIMEVWNYSTIIHDRVAYFESAWYFVNMYTGQATWRLPSHPAPGAPQLFPDGLLCCEVLDQVPLTGVGGRYTALSYCAGSPRNTAEILVDGELFHAFANLEHAIECIRSTSVSHDGDSSILIWTDQICIDQSDLQERSQQVSIMREIYDQASQVHVVLSTASTPDDVLQRAVAGREAFKNMTSAVPTTISEQDATAAGRADSLVSRLLSVSNIDIAVDRFGLCCGLFAQIFAAPWWTRAWVFQEFMLAARAYIIFGPGVRLPWPEVEPWISMFGTKSQRVFDDWADRGSQGSMAPTFFSGSTSGLRMRVKAMKLADHNAMHFVRIKGSFDGHMNLYLLLVDAWRLAATDPRDKIFSLMGLIDQQLAIVADYSETTSIIKVLVEATEKVIQSKKSLSLLRHVVLRSRVNHGLRLPSWAPDWTCGTPLRSNVDDASGFIEGDVQEIEENPQQEGMVAEVLWDPAIRSCARLRLRGLFLGKLRTLRGGTASYEWWQKFNMLANATGTAYMVTTTSQARAGDELWILRGAAGFWVLRPRSSSDFWLVFCAGLHDSSCKSMAEIHVQSSTLYGALAAEGRSGKREALDLTLI